MLQVQTVADFTFTLLKELMRFSSAKDFNLAGGTALALQIGHRTSTDLDFFGKTNLELSVIKTDIAANYEYRVEVHSRNIMIGFIDGVKVDFVKYNYPLLRPIIELDGIRLLALEDIACMKLAAITGRGKKRDFFDLYFLLQRFSLAEILKMYQEKYSDASLQMVLKSLTYFEDAELDEIPYLFEEVSWDVVKEKIKMDFLAFYNTL